jgi:hypothetical protein
VIYQNYSIKKKNDLNISVDAEKAFAQIQHLLKKTSFRELKMDGNFLILDKRHTPWLGM